MCVVRRLASCVVQRPSHLHCVVSSGAVIATWPPMVLQYALPWQQHFNKTLKTMAPSAGGKPSLVRIATRSYDDVKPRCLCRWREFVSDRESSHAVMCRVHVDGASLCRFLCYRPAAFLRWRCSVDVDAAAVDIAPRAARSR